MADISAVKLEGVCVARVGAHCETQACAVATKSQLVHVPGSEIHQPL